MLTRSQLQYYSENGFVGPLPALFSDAGRVQDHVEALLDRESQVYPDALLDRDPPVVIADLPVEDRRGRRKALARVRDRHLEDPVLAALVTHPTVTRCVEAILGPHLMVWRSNVFDNKPRPAFPHWETSKGPRTPEMQREGVFTVFHQGVNFAGVTGVPSIVPGGGVTAWIALDDTTVDNGCMTFLPRTHRLGAIPLTGQHGRFVNELAWKLDLSTAHPVELKAGEFVLFDEMLVHGSTMNRTTRRRRGFGIRFVAPSTYVNKATWPHDPDLCADMPDPGATGPLFPRLRYPLEDLARDNFGLPLDRWGCVMARGRDPFGFNRAASMPEPAEWVVT